MTPRKKKAASKVQKPLAKYGEHGRTVRLFAQGELFRVQCRALGITRSFRGEGARQRAEGFAKRLSEGMPDTPRTPTVGEVWELYRASSDSRELRERTRVLMADLWRYFVLVVPSYTRADDVTVLVLDQVRRTLESTPRPRAPNGLALSTVRHVIGAVKTVFAWAERSDVINRNRIHSFVFKVGKERRTESPAEYSADEFRRMLAALSFDVPGERTAYCLLALIGYQGVRSNAATQLRWEDVLWDDDALVWRAETDKMGNEWLQPMRAPTRAVLARLHAAQGSPGEGWVFPARQRGAKLPYYTKNSFWLMLRKAEKRAGVPHLDRRASHGLRRMVAGDLLEATGSDRLAMEGIGDRDEKQARKYVKRRLKRVAGSLRLLDEPVDPTGNGGTE